MYSSIITRTNNAFSASDKALVVSLSALALFIALEILFSPFFALAIAGCIALAVCSWHRPLWVVVAIVCVLPFEPFALKWVGEEFYILARYVSESAIYALAGVTFIKKWIRTERLSLGSLGLPLALFAGVAVVSAIANHNDLFDSIMGLRQIFRFILLYAILAWIRPTERWILNLMRVIFCIAVFESMLGIAQALAGGRLDAFLMPSAQKFVDSITLTLGTTGFWEEGQRVFATMGRYDQLGTFLAVAVLMAIGFLLEKSKKLSTRFLWLTLGTGLVALALTYSRAAWFGFAIGLAVCGIAIKRNRHIAAGYIIAVMLAVGIYTTLGIAQQYRIDVPSQSFAERLFESVSVQRLFGEYYALGRTYFLLHVPRSVLEHAPLVGVGPGMFGAGAAAALHNTEKYAELNLPYGINGTEGYIDNNWLSLLGEMGYVGLIAYIFMFIALARIALRVYRSSNSQHMRALALGYCGALAAFAFQGFFATYFEMRTIAPYIWIFGGILAAEGMNYENHHRT